ELGREVVAEVAHVVERRRLGLQLAGSGHPAAELVRDAVEPARVTVDPGAQEAAQIAAARDGREIVEGVQQVPAGQPLDDAETEDGAADTAARKAEGREAVRMGVDPPVDLAEAALAARLELGGEDLLEQQPQEARSVRRRVGEEHLHLLRQADALDPAGPGQLPDPEQSPFLAQQEIELVRQRLAQLPGRRAARPLPLLETQAKGGREPRAQPLADLVAGIVQPGQEPRQRPLADLLRGEIPGRGGQRLARFRPGLRQQGLELLLEHLAQVQGKLRRSSGTRHEPILPSSSLMAGALILTLLIDLWRVGATEG